MLYAYGNRRWWTFVQNRAFYFFFKSEEEPKKKKNYKFSVVDWHMRKSCDSKYIGNTLNVQHESVPRYKLPPQHTLLTISVLS